MLIIVLYVYSASINIYESIKCAKLRKREGIIYWNINMTKTRGSEEKYKSLEYQDCHYETSFKGKSNILQPGNNLNSIEYEKSLHFFVTESTRSHCVKQTVISECKSFQYDRSVNDIICYSSEDCSGSSLYLTSKRKIDTEIFIPQHLSYFYNYRDLEIDYTPIQKQYLPLPDISKFKDVNIVELDQKIKEIVALVQSNKFASPIIDNIEKIGIIICGYDGIIKELMILLKHLRKYSELPIQVFHANDLHEDNINRISEYSTVINLSSSSLFKPRGHQGQDDSRNYHLKPLAMLSTTFVKVIYLDSDAFPLFQSHDFSNIFHLLDTVDMYLFRDYWMMSPDNPIMKIFNTKTQRQTDSSVVIFNKEKCENVLLTAYYLTRDAYFDLVMFGDKDSFWIANTILQPYELGSILYVNSDMVGIVEHNNCGYGMAHSIAGVPAFLHMNGFKERIRKMIPIPQNMKMKMMASKDDTLKDDFSQTFEITWSEGNCVKPFSSNPIIDLEVVDLSIILEYFK